MLYNTGTIAINGNTATGTGTNWTAPASQIRVGQTLFVLSDPVQMFQITAINSATSLTITPAASPALSGQKYGILVTDSLSVDGLAQSMSQLINEYDENIGAWETFATTSANQNITVTINGARVTIPAIGKLVQKGSNGAVGVSDGGTGATNAADARTNLGLGTSATKDTGTSNGNVIQVGGFGIGADSSLASQLASLTDGYRAGLYRMRGDGAPPSTIGAPVGSGNSIIGLVSIPVYSSAGFGLAFNRDNIWTGTFDPASPSAVTWKKWWGEANTTVDTNGFIKRASPVVKLFGTGEIECNDEAEGVTASREAAGVYRVTGSCGLNSEGWTVEIPQDINGNFLCFVDIKTADDGVLTVSVFRRRFDVEKAMIIAGDPMDIPDGRWIDLRLQMPDDSLFNQKNKVVEPTLINIQDE
ncbi:phage tail protein [Enterobacter hormaechei]|uniref:phage tail fiber protein n=1 Tax=Enterobacter hormaechei TaxID=158836 RepID=UPI003754FC4B